MSDPAASSDRTHRVAAPADGSPRPLAERPPEHLAAWVRQLRSRTPDEPLAKLVDHRTTSTPILLELAVLDLMERRRHGQEARVEDYLTQFPRLAESEADRLDLLDAELCVRRERGDLRPERFYVERFPDLVEPIRQLLQLAPSPHPWHSPADTAAIAGPESPPARRGQGDGSGRDQFEDRDEVGDHICGDDSSGEDAEREFSVQRDLTVVATGARPERVAGQETGELAGGLAGGEGSIDTPLPIRPPAWLSGARCVATSPHAGGRSWLLKGRDAERGEMLAMKIVPLSATLGRKERTRVLDLCELSSSVAHPAWLPPRIAALDRGHLAIIRPWVFGAVGPFVPAADGREAYQCLIQLAWALGAAHRLGATHGGVHFGNLVVDHQSQACWIDVMASVGGWSRYLSDWDNRLAQTLPRRVEDDARGLAGMIAQTAVRRGDQGLLALLADLERRLDYRDRQACVQIGEALQSFLDRGGRGRRGWPWSSAP